MIVMLPKKNDTQLIWPSKHINENTSISESFNIPFQVIETINENIATRNAMKKRLQKTLFDLWYGDEGNSFDSGWTNKLIWGENKYILSSLIKKFSGKINVIYIDPPFATGADFSFTILLAGQKIQKCPTAIEQKVYCDTWGKGLDSYLQMMYERLQLMYLLLADDGSIYVHLDHHVGHYIKIIMDEIFGRENFRNEILVNRIRKNVNEYTTVKKLNIATDIILFYAKSDAHRIFPPKKKEKKKSRVHSVDAAGFRKGMDYELFGHKPPAGCHWRWDKEKAEEKIAMGILRANPKTGKPEYVIPETNETLLTTLWDDVSGYSFNYNYPTEKSEKLIERILRMSAKAGDLVADFFCGSGTTLAVAEKNGMRWIGCDLSRFAINTTRKRIMKIKKSSSFEILNIGRYERQAWQASKFNSKERESILYEYLIFILKLYNAEPITGFKYLHGKKNKSLIHIGSIESPVTIDEIEKAVIECKSARQKELHILGWEWEMGIPGLIEQNYKNKGIKLRLLTIPNEVMDAKAVERGDIKFFDLAYVNANIKINKKTVEIELLDFAISNTELISEDIRNNYVGHWSDFIDYWAVDFDFKNDAFDNDWSTFRNQKNDQLSLNSNKFTYEKHGKYKIVIKIIDIFGIDTSRLYEVEV